MHSVEVEHALSHDCSPIIQTLMIGIQTLIMINFINSTFKIIIPSNGFQSTIKKALEKNILSINTSTSPAHNAF